MTLFFAEYVYFLEVLTFSSGTRVASTMPGNPKLERMEQRLAAQSGTGGAGRSKPGAKNDRARSCLKAN
jgi:hypothetical protein